MSALSFSLGLYLGCLHLLLKHKSMEKPEMCQGEESEPLGETLKRQETLKKINQNHHWLFNNSNWTVPKKKETTGVLSNTQKMRLPRKITTAHDTSTVRAVKKNRSEGIPIHPKKEENWNPSSADAHVGMCKNVQRWGEKVLDQMFKDSWVQD